MSLEKIHKTVLKRSKIAFNQSFQPPRFENDRFNALVLSGLHWTWRQVTMLRALNKYLYAITKYLSLLQIYAKGKNLRKNAGIARLTGYSIRQRF